MPDRIAEASARELESVVEAMFEIQPRFPAATPDLWLSYAPITGHLYVVGEDHTAQRLAVCRALVADLKYRKAAPAGWPPLPTHRKDIEAALEADDIRHNVAGLFGDSLRTEYWNLQHPGLSTFASGLMACRSTPIEIRRDPELLEEFPPRKLAGLCSDLSWRSPETLRQARRMERMVRKHEAAQERVGAEG